MNAKIMRKDPLFLRNSSEQAGKYELPLVKRQTIDIDKIQLIPYSDTKPHDSDGNRLNGVHFFVDDYRFRDVFRHPDRSFQKLSQYAFVLTPDFSLYAEMPLWQQICNVGQNRWCGFYWQSKGLSVIPTISWSTSQSFDFCFDGVERGSVVAVSTLGCRKSEHKFMLGYKEMLRIISPETVICYGKTFKGMDGEIVVIEYNNRSKK